MVRKFGHGILDTLTNNHHMLKCINDGPVSRTVFNSRQGTDKYSFCLKSWGYRFGLLKDSRVELCETIFKYFPAVALSKKRAHIELEKESLDEWKARARGLELWLILIVHITIVIYLRFHGQ